MNRRFFTILIFFSLGAFLFAEPKAKDIAAEAAKKANVDESISYVQGQISKLIVASEKRAAYVFQKHKKTTPPLPELPPEMQKVCQRKPTNSL